MEILANEKYDLQLFGSLQFFFCGLENPLITFGLGFAIVKMW
jgi:hypothetical protein